MSEQESLQKQLDKARRRLAIREEQLAAKGRLNADPEIIIDIEETQELIADLEKRIFQANSKLPQPEAEQAAPVQPPKFTPQSEPKPETKQEKLLREIDDPHTNHKRRLEIGDKLSQIGDTRPGVGLRADGLPDIAWLPVTPGGDITIKKVTFTVQPFYIAKYLVTYAQYEAFTKAEDGYNNLEWWREMPQENQKQILLAQNFKNLNNPRDAISWYQSIAFTRWLNSRLQGLELPSSGNSPLIVGKNAQVRLPLEWEWQWAAQGGSSQRQYPWGAWKDGYANIGKYFEIDSGRTTAVGMYPQGAAKCGALDMAGNFQEWCLNDYDSIQSVSLTNNKKKSVRGGNFFFVRNIAACASRFFGIPTGVSSGIRVVAAASV